MITTATSSWTAAVSASTPDCDEHHPDLTHAVDAALDVA